MRTLSKFLTLLLCLELIVSPIAPNLSVLASNEARAEDCPTGFSFDSTLNRCLTKTETANVMNATMSCGSDVQCYKENAQKALQDKVNAGEAPERKGGGGFVSTIGTAASTAAVTFAVMSIATGDSKCKSSSFYGMIAGGAAVVLGDNLANMGHKKRLKKIKEDWGKIVNPEDAAGDKDKERSTSIEAQSQAFEMLARAEDSLAQAAKMKKNFFMIASLAFGVTAAMSAMEMITNKGFKTDAVAQATLAVTKTSAAAVTEGATTPPNPAAGQALGDVQAAAAKVSLAAKSHEAFEAGFKGEAAIKQDLVGATGKMKEMRPDDATKAKVEVSIESAEAALLQAKTKAAASPGANPAVTSAHGAFSKWKQHTEQNTCESTSENQNTYFKNEVPTSLYSYYINPSSNNLKAEIQFLYNLKNSEDMTSFVMNKKEMDGELIDPIFEYNSYKDGLNELSLDKSSFELFKETSLFVINQMNPISSAFAVEAVQSESTADLGAPVSATSSTSTTGNNSTSSSSVNTNAAKAFKEDEGKGIDFMSIGLGIGAGVAMSKIGGVNDFMITSKGRLIFSGVMAGMTFMMSQHAGKQAEASTKRAELLRKMKDEFSTASGAIFSCKSEDRNDPAKPNCYCYTSENAKNSNRSNSQICQKLWAGINTTAGNYSTLATSNKVCVNQNQQADATCACRASNTCMKVKLNGVSGLGMGSMSVLGGAIAPLNKVMDGTIDGANIDGASLANNAAKVNALNKQLEKNPIIANAKNSKAALQLQKRLQSGGASLPSGSLFGGSGSSSMPSNPGQAATMLEKELKDATAPTVGGGDLADFTPAAAPEEALEFGLTGDQLAAQESQIAEVMKEDLDYGGNDINQGSKTNIFEVLSNRYQRSGMRRLFDEKGVTKPEAAAKTDITQ